MVLFVVSTLSNSCYKFFWVIVKAIETKILLFIIDKKGRGSHGFPFVRSLTDSPWTLLDFDNESLDIPPLNGHSNSKS